MNETPKDFPASLCGKHLVVVRVPMEIIFSVDPAELEGRGSELQLTERGLIDYLNKAIIMDMDLENVGQPSGMVFQSAAMKLQSAQIFKP